MTRPIRVIYKREIPKTISQILKNDIKELLRKMNKYGIIITESYTYDNLPLTIVSIITWYSNLGIGIIRRYIDIDSLKDEWNIMVILEADWEKLSYREMRKQTEIITILEKMACDRYLSS